MSLDINLLGGGAALAGALSALLYMRRKRWPDAALAATAGAALAALLAAPVAPPQAQREPLLITDKSPTTAPDDALAAAMAAAPQAARLQVQGQGLREAQWRDLPLRPVQWTPPQSELLWLDFPRTLPLGRSFALTARRAVALPGWRLQLLAENGQLLAEGRAAQARQALTVQWQPPLAESMVLQARLLDQEGKLLAQGPVPLRVLDALPLQVQGRFGAPSFDARVLNQLLTDSNALLDWQTTLGKSLARSEQARAPLTHTHALVADAAWLEHGGLRAALGQVAQGLPLLVLGGNAEDAAFWQRELGLKLAAQSATTESEDTRQLALPGATLALPAAPWLPAGGWKVLAQDKDGKPWLWQRDWQKGRVLWLGVRDWHRYAISEPGALGQWWQQVLDLAALRSEQKVQWLEADPMPLAGLRSEVCAQGVAPGADVTVGADALHWQARSERADAACVAVWPRAAGWLALRSGDASSAMYVYGAQDWPAWQAALRHDATARFASRYPALGTGSADHAEAAGKAAPGGAAQRATALAMAPLTALGWLLPRWLLGALLAASLLALWWREQR